jgi:predicted ATPase
VEVEEGLTTFVGRDRELQTLHDSFSRAQDGHGQVIFVVGEAGIGKSQLLLEFHRQLDTTDVTWLEGRSMSFGRAMAFHPLIDLLKRNFRIEEEDSETTIVEKIDHAVLRLGDDLRPILPYLRHLLAVDPGDEIVQRMDPQLRRAELFDALRLLMVRASEVQPQVLVLEDLHWMDQATEDFLRAIADSIPTSRVLCLFTYRPGYHHPFGDRTYHTRLVLPTLSKADSNQMAQAMLSAMQLSQEVETLLIQKAEGNPLFIEEVVKSLQEMGTIHQSGNDFVLTSSPETLNIPNTIQDLLMARIDRLDEAVKHVLQ